MGHSFTANNIFITGAAAGIGRATAKYFAQKGWFVGLYDIDAAGLSALRDELGADNCCVGQMDVTDIDSVRAALEHFSERSSGALSVLFNSAGVCIVGPFESVDLSYQHHTIDVNFKGIVNCCHAALPYLKESAGARVVNMSSASATHGTPDYPVYSATKSAVSAFTEALNIEWRQFDISLCDLLPPFVNTAMVRDNPRTVSMKKLGVKLEADDVAKVVWKAAHGRGLHYPLGTEFKILYYVARILPTRLQQWVTRFVSGY